MSKTRQAIIIEHWLGIDQALLGKPASQALSGEVFEQYITTKAALLSNLFELYVRVGFDPGYVYENNKELAESAKVRATEATNKARTILEDEDVIAMIKHEISEESKTQGLKESAVANFVVKKRLNAVVLDSMLVENAALEGCRSCLENFQGKLLLNAHKMLRDSLIDIALS